MVLKSAETFRSPVTSSSIDDLAMATDGPRTDNLFRYTYRIDPHRPAIRTNQVSGISLPATIAIYLFLVIATSLAPQRWWW